MENKGKILMHSCFDYLRGAYSRQQALNIMLGVATIKWMEQSEKYYRSAGLIIQALMNSDHLGDEIERLNTRSLKEYLVLCLVG